MPRMTVALPDWAVVTPDRLAHIERVAALLEQWADALAVPDRERRRWRKAAALHDALKDAPIARQRELAPDAWSVDPLVHGPAAAVVAEREGEDDRGVLDAVRYHSVGYARWDHVGRMLFLADYLEPGRTFLRNERRQLAEQVPDDAQDVLCRVLRQRMEHLSSVGVNPLPETLAFWRALRCDV